MKRIAFIFFLLLIFISHTANGATQKFITLADIHFNPFIGCDPHTLPCPLLTELRAEDPASWDAIFKKYDAKITSKYYQDTDFHLLTSTLAELHTLSLQQKPAFILLLGDFLAHGFSEQYQLYSGTSSKEEYQAFVRKTYQYLTYQLNQAAPKIALYPVLGNNDSYDGNYAIQPSLFLKDTADIFSSFIKDKTALEEFKTNYIKAGYYSVSLSPKKRLLILNSVLFSTRSSTPEKQKAADEQLDWLNRQLSIAKQENQQVLIIFHIPLGIDIYLDKLMRFDIVRALIPPLFWQTNYNSKFLSLIQTYSTLITGILPAHIHKDSFQLIANDTHTSFIPVSMTPSISPIFGNNPALKVFSYNDKTFELTDFDTYFCPLEEERPTTWQKEYQFNTIYQPGCKNCLLVNGMQQLKQNNGLMSSYQKYYAVEKEIDNAASLNYWCGIYNTDWGSYKTCE